MNARMRRHTSTTQLATKRALTHVEVVTSGFPTRLLRLRLKAVWAWHRTQAHRLLRGTDYRFQCISSWHLEIMSIYRDVQSYLQLVIMSYRLSAVGHSRGKGVGARNVAARERADVVGLGATTRLLIARVASLATGKVATLVDGAASLQRCQRKPISSPVGEVLTPFW